MSSVKMLVGDLCLILLFALYSVTADDKVQTTKHKDDGSSKPKCSCGGFPTTTPEAGAQPLLSQSPDLPIKCDDEGEATCKRLCMALATAAKAQGPSLICSRLKTANELTLSAFFKICEKPWKYIENMTEVRPLCCEDSKVKVCASVASKMRNCTCGVFKTQIADTSPLLDFNAAPIVCDEEGVTECANGCASLLSNNKNFKEYTDNICEKLKSTVQFQPSGFSKPCDKPWSFILHMGTLPRICCDNGKTKQCKS